ncbi:MAG: NADPH-dependent glutamate synthase [Bacillota bacterium]
MAERNMSLQKNPMPEQDPNVRNRNFDEVAQGYTGETAVSEAMRCLGCKNPPCVLGCPVNVKIPEFIKCIQERRFRDAYLTIKETNSLPAVCGRVCPQETQCEAKCVRGKKGEPVAIGRLERFAADWYLQNCDDKPAKPVSNGRRVAVLGAGPAGLTCAGDLAMLGYDVTVFEAFHAPGGVLIYGIPEFRLPKAIVKHEIEKLEEIGVRIETNTIAGKAVSIDELFEEGFEAVFIGTGAGLPMFMNIPGENLNGVFSANEFLTRINLMKAYRDDYDTPVFRARNVAVVGGGNVAMDSARCAKRLGAENVYIVYRRSEKEMPARAEEVHHAKEEGIIFRLLCNPVRILGDDKGWVKGMECVEMELGEPDASGRRRPVEKQGSEFTLDVDCVVMAIGTSPNPTVTKSTSGLETNKRGCIVADEETGLTTLEGVYAGGDAVTGAATVILAMGAGKSAAKAIDAYLRSKG